MKKIIVKKDDVNAIEVMKNHGVYPRMGMNPLSYREMVIKERKVARQVKDIRQRGKSPKILHLLIDFGIFTEEDKVRLHDVFSVFRKVSELFEQGFHTQVITSMMRCTAGFESEEWQFDEKFARALYSSDTREEFWGTKYLLPIILVQYILVDLMSGINVYKPTENDLRNSMLVEYVFANYKKEAQEAEFEEFIRSYT